MARKRSTEPSPRQAEAWKAICEFWSAHGKAPLQRELAERLGVGTQTVRGKVRHDYGENRDCFPLVWHPGVPRPRWWE